MSVVAAARPRKELTARDKARIQASGAYDFATGQGDSVTRRACRWCHRRTLEGYDRDAANPALIVLEATPITADAARELPASTRLFALIPHGRGARPSELKSSRRRGVSDLFPLHLHHDCPLAPPPAASTPRREEPTMTQTAWGQPTPQAGPWGANGTAGPGPAGPPPETTPPPPSFADALANAGNVNPYLKWGPGGFVEKGSRGIVGTTLRGVITEAKTVWAKKMDGSLERFPSGEPKPEAVVTVQMLPGEFRPAKDPDPGLRTWSIKNKPLSVFAACVYEATGTYDAPVGWLLTGRLVAANPSTNGGVEYVFEYHLQAPGTPQPPAAPAAPAPAPAAPVSAAQPAAGAVASPWAGDSANPWTGTPSDAPPF